MLLKSYGLFVLLTKFTPIPDSLCKIIAEISFFVLNYIAQKKLIFRKKRS